MGGGRRVFLFTMRWIYLKSVYLSNYLSVLGHGTGLTKAKVSDEVVVMSYHVCIKGEI